MTTDVVDITQCAFLDGVAKRLLIDGQWVDACSGATFPSVDPSTGRVIADVAAGDVEDVNRAVSAARRAFTGPWSKLRPAERQRLMLDLADAVEAAYGELRLIESADMGMPIGAAPERWARHETDFLRTFAGWATRLGGETVSNSQFWSVFTYTLKEPIGVVASIIPWNSPINNVLWKLAPVLASGCTMVLKPAEEASLVALRIGELACAVGIPDGVVNVVTGMGETVGAALTAHPDVDKVAFTGSTQTGQHIVRAAAGNLKRLTLELGGKSPDVVFADADLRRAVAGVAMGVFGNSGQACCAGTRIFVERPIFEEFAAAVTEYTGKLRVGNGLDPDTQIGPVVSSQQLERVCGYLDLGPTEGARVLVGGSRLEKDAFADGFYVAPTLFVDVDDQMQIAREEIFGPVGCLLPFDTVEEVIARSNATEFGLAGGVWTKDVSKAHALAHGLRTGTVWVNTYNLFDPMVPFGGYKMSGWGSECGPEALDPYLNTKSVWIRTD